MKRNDIPKMPIGFLAPESRVLITEADVKSVLLQTVPGIKDVMFECLGEGKVRLYFKFGFWVCLFPWLKKKAVLRANKAFAMFMLIHQQNALPFNVPIMLSGDEL
jgi:hypothetical protein